MDDKTIISVALALVALIGVMVKLHRDFIVISLPREVDRLIASSREHDENAAVRHEQTVGAVKALRKAMKRWKRKKCRQKPFQDAPGATRTTRTERPPGQKRRRQA